MTASDCSSQRRPSGLKTGVAGPKSSTRGSA